MRRSRLVRTAVVSTAAVLVLAGCNGSADEATTLGALSPVAAIQKVADNASNDSAAYTFELSGKGLDVHGTGAFAGGGNPAAQMVFDKISLTGLAGLVGNSTLPEGLEFRLVDDVMYLKVVGDSGLLPGLGDGEWVKLPVDDLKAEGTNLGGLDPTMADPREQLQKMLDTEDVRVVGKETLDGVSVTHYEAKIDAGGTGTVVEKRTPEARSELEKQLESSLEDSIRSTLGVDSPVEVDLWVDDEYRARKLAVELPFLDGATMTMKFKDFGSAVNVAAPADAKVLDLGDVLGGSMGTSFGDLFGEEFGKSFGKSFGNGEDFSKDFSQEFEDKLRTQIEGRLKEGFGSSLSDEDFEDLVRNS